MRTLLRRPAIRFALVCLGVLPLAACTGISMSCGSAKSIESGTVEVAGAPASAERGDTIRLDLTGSKLVNEGTDLASDPKYRCITYISTSWSDAEDGYQDFTVPAAQRCQPLDGFTIDVKVPARKRLTKPGEALLFGSANATYEPYTGGTLTIQANGYRDESSDPNGRITWVGNRLVAWKELQITVPPAANAAPTADLFARMAPMPAQSLTDSGAYPVGFAAVDARMSSDPEGGALAYAWDLDGDGEYDDPADGGSGATGLAAGVAIVPGARRQANGPTWVAVRVTDTAGLVASKRLDVVVSDGSGVDGIPPTPKITGLDPAIASAGATLEIVFASSGSDSACVDPDGGDPLSAAGRVHNLDPSTGGSARFPITAGAVGNHRVSAAFWFGYLPASCSASGLSTPRFTWSDVYTSTAPRRAPKTYAARVRLTTTKAVPIASSVSNLGILTDVVGRGRYALSAPAKAKGVTRPKALALFRRGDYAASAPAVDFIGAGATETPVGTSTMLLRGRGGVLACVRAVSTTGGTAYSFLGGTGAARRLQVEAVAGPAKARLPAKPAKKIKPQRRPVRGNATMAAATGSPRGLPAACKALIRHLP